MELMLVTIFLIFAVLAIYLVVEESILRQYGISESIEEAQWHADQLHKIRMWRQLHETQQTQTFSLLDRLHSIVRW